MTEGSAASAAGNGSALLVRVFGWATLAALGAFLVNNFAGIAFGWPGIITLFEDTPVVTGVWIQLVIYVAAIGAATTPKAPICATS